MTGSSKTETGESMRVVTSRSLLLTTAAVALAASTGIAAAGGFAIREQSAESQGMSFAGNAAMGSLSAMFWNPAQTASRDGMNFESSYSILMPRAEVHVDSATPGAGFSNQQRAGLQAFLNASPSDADGIAPTALVPASYGNFQYGNIYIGMGVNGAFGLTTEPNKAGYKGAPLAETTKLFTMNFNPTIAMKVMPGVTIGAGLQAQTAEGTLRFLSVRGRNADGLTGPMASFEGNGWAFGGTAGITVEPAAGTTIGVGYRSRLNQELEGNFNLEGVRAVNARTELKLPDIVTISLRQVVASNMRLNATFEWSKWSEFKDLTLRTTEAGAGPLNRGSVGAGGLAATIPANWSDGYFVAVGGEYDLSPTLTARAGFAYEKSPVDDPTKRIIGIPDANRYWLSAGLSWKALANTTFDLAYTHVFIEDSSFDRDTAAPISAAGAPIANQTIHETGSIKSSLDIVSASMKTRF